MSIRWVLIVCFTVFPLSASAETIEEVIVAFRKIEKQMQTYTEQDAFETLLQDARDRVRTLAFDPRDGNCAAHFKRALEAYDIVNHIWRNQEQDSTVDAGWACVPAGTYESWLKSFPSLLTWKWGRGRVGISAKEQTFFEPFDCYIILKPFLDDIWAPCLFYQAKQEIDRAEVCFKADAN